MEKKQERNNMTVANNMTTENKLKRILDLFFGMNPRNKFWLLEVLLLAKRGELVICNNEIEADDFILCAVDTSILAVTGGTEKTLQEWEEKGIKTKYAVGRTTTDIKVLFSEIDMSFTEQGGKTIFTLKQTEPLDLMEIVRIVCSLPSDWFQSGVGVFAEEVLSFIARNEGKSGGIYLQPIQVSHLILDLLDVKDGSVYNPYAGMASYGAILNDNVEYHAQEISQIYLIARLNLLLHGKDDSRCVQGNSISEWDEQSFDYIVATPPFNARISERRNDTMEADFFARAYNQARKKVAAVVSGYFCAATGGLAFSIRKTLIEKDLVEYVIKLPNNLFFETNIPAFVIVLNREKEDKGKVKFIDASECFKKQGIKNVLDESIVISLLNSEDRYHFAAIDNSKIFAHNCFLIPEGYIERLLIEEKKGENYIKLEHVLTPCSRQNVELCNGEHPIVIFPFTDMQFSVKSSELTKKSVNTHVPACIIEEDCIIIDTRRQLRSVYVTIDSTPAYYMPYYHAFKVDTTLITPEYLVMQLRQPYMAKQIVVDNVVSTGVSPEFYIAKVLTPSLEEQKAAVIRYKEQLLQEMGMQLNDLFDKKRADYINVIRARKHDMRPYVRELGSIERMMRQYIHNIEASAIAPKMSSLLDQHKIALDKLKDLIDIFSEEQQFGKPEQFNINQYFVDLEVNHDETSGYWIEYDRDDNAIAEYGIPVPCGGPCDENLVPLDPDSELFKEIMEEENKFPLIVDINHVDFERLVRNIIENAVTHGFTDSNREDYGIGIDLTIDMDKRMFQIDFSNNGTPLPSGMDKQRYGILGEKAGTTARTGRGGYIVKSIVEHYHGDYDVFMNGQNTVVRILLPISSYDYEYEQDI